MPIPVRNENALCAFIISKVLFHVITFHFNIISKNKLLKTLQTKHRWECFQIQTSMFQNYRCMWHSLSRGKAENHRTNNTNMLLVHSINIDCLELLSHIFCT